MQDLGSYDYIIVGGGSAGCVLANRLSADPGKRVLLLEAGGKDNWIWIHIPVGYLYGIGNPRTDWCSTTEPRPGLNGRALDYPRGKVLGGCSSINGMIYMRGQARDYDGWRQLGNAGWGWDDVLPYFQAHEDHCRAAPNDFHGARRRMARRGAAPALGDPRRLPRGRAARSASPRSRISTAATTRAPAISRSTSGAAGAGARRAASSAGARRGRTSACVTGAHRRAC